MCSNAFLTRVLCLRLHMLCELEHAFSELPKESTEVGGSKKTEPKLNWDARLLMTQNSFRAKEPILALRRALLSLSKGYEDILLLLGKLFHCKMFHFHFRKPSKEPISEYTFKETVFSFQIQTKVKFTQQQLFPSPCF